MKYKCSSLFLILVILFFKSSHLFASEKDTLIINVTKIITNKIESARWLKNSVARADLFNIPTMVAVFEGDRVDVSKTDGEDPIIFSKVIAKNIISQALNTNYSNFNKFTVDTIFDERIEEQKTNLYILRNYISPVENKRKPIFVVSTEILHEMSFNFIGKNFQDSVLAFFRETNRDTIKKSITKKKKKKISWFKRKKRKHKTKVEDIDSLEIVVDTSKIKDTVTKVFIGTDSTQSFTEDSSKSKAFIIFILVLLCLVVFFLLFWFIGKKE